MVERDEEATRRKRRGKSRQESGIFIRFVTILLPENFHNQSFHAANERSKCVRSELTTENTDIEGFLFFFFIMYLSFVYRHELLV